MPWVEHFRFIKPYPERLQYADASVVLEIVEDFPFWRFQARKLTPDGAVCVLHHAFNERRLRIDLFDAGFPRSGGSRDPQSRIMDRLCASGYAITARLKLNGKTGLRL